MSRIPLLLILLLTGNISLGQVKPVPKERPIGSFNINERVVQDTTKNYQDRKPGGMQRNDNATIDLYKIISHENDTTYVDTTLTLQKEYKFNYLCIDVRINCVFLNKFSSWRYLISH